MNRKKKIVILTSSFILLCITIGGLLSYCHCQATLAEEQRIAVELAQQEAAQAKAEAQAKVEAEQKAKEEAEAAAKAEAEKKAQEEAAAKAEAEKQETAKKEEQKTETSQESEKKTETTNTSNKDDNSTSSQTVVQRANTDTGVSWDGKSPIVYTYTDGTTGTTPKDGATYEVVPGLVGTYEEPIVTTPTTDEGCPYCNRPTGDDGSNGHCVRWSLSTNNHNCAACGEVVPPATCHTCS